MMRTSRLALACIFLLLAVQATVTQAQSSLAQLRSELISPWLVTLQGQDRSLLLRINEISQDTEGSYIVSANYGWIDGVQSIVRIELILTGQDRRLIVRENSGDLYSLLQSPNGEFTGTFKTLRGAERTAKMEKVSEDRLPQLAKESQARMAARTFADEDKDWSVAPTKSPRTGRLHAPTPKELPGAKTIRTMELRSMQGRSPAPILIDVLGGQGHRTVAGAHWLREPGEAPFGNAERERFREDLEKLTSGRKAAPIVFFCLSSECWMSYNAGLRALELGYTNVHWYRGGTEAWNRAGFEMREAEPYRR